MARPDERTNYAKYVMWRAYLGEPNMTQWSVPEISSEMQFRCAEVMSIEPHSQKLRQNQFFA